MKTQRLPKRTDHFPKRSKSSPHPPIPKGSFWRLFSVVVAQKSGAGTSVVAAVVVVVVSHQTQTTTRQHRVDDDAMTTMTCGARVVELPIRRLSSSLKCRP
jgi:hypothetical protein